MQKRRMPGAFQQEEDTELTSARGGVDQELSGQFNQGSATWKAPHTARRYITIKNDLNVGYACI